MKHNNLSEAIIDYMQEYNKRNDKALCDMYTNYMDNKDTINSLNNRKLQIQNRINKKEKKLNEQAIIITKLTSEYRRNVAILNAISKKYFEYDANFITKIFNYQRLKKLKDKIEKYTLRNRFLMIEIKTRDEFYVQEQQNLIELENMLTIIQSQLDIYENPYQNIEIENRNNDLLDYMNRLNKGKISF